MLLDYDAVADELGVSPRTVSRKINSGEWDLPVVDLGPQTKKVARSDLREFIDRHRRQVGKE